ncbi:MAG: Chemotaxis protein cheA [Candidatus Magnetoglobus multicellularis str. Araruama]|uniref:histidine kinase n=1 Tax=Candidatus Magnetoglobus multicellularis str. Araruama TaxID=890399 RepID=A0A1V1PIK3_9BACT|nr:MAG: Chemotaxis protein cheA [Candidatus Magnetoglobus multicellularis str. Araruama]
MQFDQNMLNEFIAEAKEHLDNIEDNFLTLESQDVPDPGLIDKVFRSIHSVKGSSGFLNLNTITRLAHVMEALLQKIRQKEILPESVYIDALLSGSDLLQTMVNDPLNSESVDIQDVYDRLQELIHASDRPEKEQTVQPNRSKQPDCINKQQKQPTDLSPDDSGELSLEKLAQSGFQIDIQLVESISHANFFVLEYDLTALNIEKKVNLDTLIKDLSGMGTIISVKWDTSADNLDVDFATIPLYCQVLYATGLNKKDIAIVLQIHQDKIHSVSIQNSPQKTNNSTQSHTNNTKQKDKPKVIKEAPKKPKKPAITKKISEKKNEQPPISKDKNESLDTKKTQETKSQNLAVNHPGQREQTDTIRISVDILDKIMNLAGELVLVRNQHLLLVDKTDTRMADNSQRLDMVTSELQEAIMRTRMQPIGTLFSRLPRIVRDISKKCNKSIIIIINGHEVELDKTILESLPDPLTHIIRNACDHGIETPEERSQVGKPETGYINVKAYHEAGQINIVIEDDGRGIDPQKIRDSVLNKGLKRKEELQRMTEKEILSLVMMPGFSTTEKTTEISGRGVGMDVVKNAVEQLGGSIELDSRVGQGLNIHMRLPLTLAIIPCLIVQVDNEKFAIPEVNVEELVSLYDEEIFTLIECNGDQEVFRLRKQLLPLVRLKEVLMRSQPFTEDDRSDISETYREIAQQKLKENDDIQQILIFAVLKIGNQRFGLIIDEVIGTEEIVVNPLHSAVNPLIIYSGTTIMGDGTVALILDVNGIAMHAGVRFTTEVEQTNKETRSSKTDSHRILLFKSGKEEQFAVPLLLMRRVELIDPSRIQTIGGNEYISVDNVPTLLIRLEKLLNVSACETADKMYLLLPKQSQRPIGILASRLVDVINLPLILNKESYMQDGLLGTAIVNEYITIFIDIYRLVEAAEKAIFGDTFVDDNDEQQSKTILLAEDTLFFQRLVKGHLVSAGYEVITADNGAEALDKMKSNKVDMIISDIEMPVMDGLDFLRAVRSDEQFPYIPAVALTSLDSEKDREIGLKAGFDAYEVKVDRDRIVEVVSKLLSK